MALTSGSHATSRVHHCVDDGDYIVFVVVVILQIETILRLPWRLFLSAKLDSVLSVSSENGLGQNVTHTEDFSYLLANCPQKCQANYCSQQRRKCRRVYPWQLWHFVFVKFFQMCGGII